MVMQVRAPDPTGRNAKGVWASPARDIAHCFPFLVRRALEAMEADLNEENMAEMNDFAVRMAKFVQRAADPMGPKELLELYREVELLDVPETAERLFGKWLTRVLCSAYFNGIHEALHPGEAALGIDQLMALPLLEPKDEE